MFPVTPGWVDGTTRLRTFDHSVRTDFRQEEMPFEFDFLDLPMVLANAWHAPVRALSRARLGATMISAPGDGVLHARRRAHACLVRDEDLRLGRADLKFVDPPRADVE